MPVPTRHLMDLSGLQNGQSPRRKWKAASFHFITVRQMPPFGQQFPFRF